MKFLILMCTYFVWGRTISHFDTVREEWVTFKTKYNKIYESEEEEVFRVKIFRKNLHEVAKHNELYAKGLIGYGAGINQFSDMAHHEFIRATSCYKSKEERNETKRSTHIISPANIDLPREFDWREKGAVTPVKNQTDNCRSCYAFSATGALEGQHFRKTRKLVSLSEQNIVDCSREFHNYGCAGGNVDNAFEYIRVNKGIDTEKYYPYVAKEGPCRYNRKYKGAVDRGYKEIRKGDEEELKRAVATEGPVSAAIDATLDTFKTFKGKDVYFDQECSSKKLNHMVLIVGYGTYKGKDYWLVKNSWGTSWGDEGYIKMMRNRKNHCGIATEALYPLM